MNQLFVRTSCRRVLQIVREVGLKICNVVSRKEFESESRLISSRFRQLDDNLRGLFRSH
ncbi:hypothetical protein PUN28_010078 [Cardiocondyla obscurior]|uniref:Uncharacterized protein n=1 Tax=Cardiocondyla obscurior TaxID=286306 RepID=A0AAW2FQB4_9HYME